MKSLVLNSIVCITLSISSVMAHAEETANPPLGPGSPAPAPAPAPSTETGWNSLLQKKYSLTDAQMQTLNDSKLPDSQKAQVAQLAKSSGKSIDEVLKMRTEDKMGWGKIAKTLGVHPGELGKAVSELKREQNRDRKKDRDSKRESGFHGDKAHGKPDHAGGGHGKSKK